MSVDDNNYNNSNSGQPSKWSNQNNSAASGRSGPSPALIAFVVVVALAVVFFLQNGNETEIDFLFFESRTTVRFSILIAIAIGIVLDRLFAIWWRRRRNRNDK